MLSGVPKNGSVNLMTLFVRNCSVERGKHRVGASVLAFRLFVGACLQCTLSCDWKSIIYVCSCIQVSGGHGELLLVGGQKKKSHEAGERSERSMFNTHLHNTFDVAQGTFKDDTSSKHMNCI